MPKFRLNKLVRDKIVENNQAEGNTPHFRSLGKEEHIEALVAKVIEEGSELNTASDDEVASEIADVQQVLDDYIVLRGLTQENIDVVKQKKLAKNGGFSKGIFVDYIEMDEDNQWTAYYRKDPERFEEYE